MVTAKDVLHVLQQKDSPIDIRVRMAKVLLEELIRQEKANETTS